MFKKIALISASLIFALAILLTSVFKTSTETCQKLSRLDSQVLAEETLEFEVVNENREASLGSEKKAVEYNLTWPGILPDHFLYPIKMIRDRIWLFLVSEPLKKAELLLRLADKRIWSAKMLVEKGKTDLAATTSTKAEKYLERAFNQERLAHQKGKETQDFLEKILKASLKHEETILEMVKKTSEPTKTIFGEALEYPRRIYQETIKRLGEES